MTDDTRVKEGETTTRESSNPLRMALLMLLLGWTAVQWLDREVEGGSPPPASPALVSPTSSPCALPKNQAVKRAAELLTRARARWERAVFAPEVATLALDDAQQAATCFERAQESDDARVAAQLADAIGAHTQRHYERLQLKLRVALQRQDGPSAMAAIRDLRGLLHDDRGAYGRWLLALEQDQRALAGVP